jgi:tetratricopeptide (TPR) repeat protein
LVARGALNANSSRFQKAIVDFEAALKIQPNHNNAKKYLGETLLALGRSFEEENKFEEAQKTYIQCLNINPHHQEALASLNYIKDKLSSRKIVEPAELELPRELDGKFHLNFNF